MQKFDSSSSIGVQLKNFVDLECAKNPVQAFSILTLLFSVIKAWAAPRENIDDILICDIS